MSTLDKQSVMPPSEAYCKIYLVTNTVNGKIYVGQTWQNLNKRWRNHIASSKSSKRGRSYFHRAIAKYGEASFRVEEIAVVTTQEEADRLEIHWITSLSTTNESYGYNTTLGGDIGILVERPEARQARLSRMSKAMKAHWADPDARARHAVTMKVSIAADPTRRARISETLKKHWSDPIARAQRISTLQASGNNPEFLAKMSAISKAQWSDPAYRKRVTTGASERAIQRWKDPLYRDRVIAAVAAGKARNKATKEAAQ